MAITAASVSDAGLHAAGKASMTQVYMPVHPAERASDVGDSANGQAAVSVSSVQVPTAPALDPRIARSKAALREALIALMEERGLEGFTVGDLCTRAGLNRGTFYNHFKDKENLLASFEDEVMEGLEAFRVKMQELEIRDLLKYRARKRPLPVLVELFDYLRKEGDFLHAVLGPGGDVRFGPRLREVVCGGLIRSLLHERYRESDDAFVGYYIAYFAGAYLGVIDQWIKTGMRESSEEMALVAMRLFFIKPGEAIRM